MIRFSAFLVVVAVGLLVAGVVTSKLLLVYIAIGVSGVALLALGVGAAVHWGELTGKPKTAAAQTSAPEPVPAPQASESLSPASASASLSAAQPGLPGPPWAAYLPAEQPLRAQPVARSAPAQPATAQAPAAAWGNGVASPDGTPESRSAAQPAGSRPAGAQRPVAFTARPEAPAPSIPPRDERAAGPPSATERKPPQTPTSVSGQSPVKDQPPAEGKTPEKEKPPAQAHPPAQAQPPADRHDGAEPAASAASIATEPPASPQPQQANQTAKPEKAANAEKATEPEPAGPDPTMEVTVVPGVSRYHNARCMLIRFMGENDLDKMTLSAARKIGCTPCRACLPDEPERSPE